MHKAKSTYLFIAFSIVAVVLFSCQGESIEATSPFYNGLDAKLWKHRVNCLNEADSLAHHFPGIEIDIYYIDSNQQIICTHGEPCAGESLETIVSSIQDYKSKYYWLDFKNSHDSLIVTKSVAVLREKLQDLGITSKSVIETRNPQCIDSLVANGLFSSYWVPHYNDVVPAYNDGQVKHLIESVLQKHQPTVLSANYTMEPLLKREFPDQFLHLWTEGLWSEESKAVINELKKNPNTKVILIDFAEPF